VKVSVIIPVFNGAAYLRDALDSVLAQTCPVYEVIVVDDGSNDDSPQILASYGDRLSIVRQQNQGVAVARNAGLRLATGEVIAFLDQDDLWPFDRMRLVADALAAHPDAEVATGLIEILDQRTVDRGMPEDMKAGRNEFLLGSLSIRARLFTRLGAFNQDVGHADDTDFWCRRIEANVKTIYLDGVTLIYRLHDNNASSDWPRRTHYLLGVIRESLKRRRSGQYENQLRRTGP
jgi:glycosyltransferase involved in cell wall biosynthesis